MQSRLHQSLADLSARTPMLLMIVAVVVFVLGYAAYLQFLEPYGLGLWTKFLAASVSLAVSVMYWLFFFPTCSKWWRCCRALSGRRSIRSSS